MPELLSTRVHVRDGRVVSVEDVHANGEEVEDGTYGTDAFKSVEELFAIVAEAEEGEVDDVSVEYDPVLGNEARCGPERADG